MSSGAATAAARAALPHLRLSQITQNLCGGRCDDAPRRRCTHDFTPDGPPKFSCRCDGLAALRARHRARIEPDADQGGWLDTAYVAFQREMGTGRTSFGGVG